MRCCERFAVRVWMILDPFNVAILAKTVPGSGTFATQCSRCSFAIAPNSAINWVTGLALSGGKLGSSLVSAGDWPPAIFSASSFGGLFQAANSRSNSSS